MISLRPLKRRHLSRIAAALAMLATALLGHAEAAFTGAPLHRAPLLQHIRLEAPTLAPLAHVRFCLQYPRDCRNTVLMFRGGRVKLTPQRLRELIAVNARVNSAIRPEPGVGESANERWVVAPPSGSCHDYAVTKRHELMAHGWPARSLLLAEVVTTWGEHHLVIVVRTRTVDLVLDNLNPDIKPWTETNYRWVRIETPQNPMFWAEVHKFATRSFLARMSPYQRHATLTGRGPWTCDTCEYGFDDQAHSKVHLVRLSLRRRAVVRPSDPVVPELIVRSPVARRLERLYMSPRI